MLDATYPLPVAALLTLGSGRQEEPLDLVEAETETEAEPMATFEEMQALVEKQQNSKSEPRPFEYPHSLLDAYLTKPWGNLSRYCETVILQLLHISYSSRRIKYRLVGEYAGASHGQTISVPVVSESMPPG